MINSKWLYCHLKKTDFKYNSILQKKKTYYSDFVKKLRNDKYDYRTHQPR